MGAASLATATPLSPTLTATAASPIAAGSDVRGLVTGVDFDGDGFVDVATVDNTAKKVSVRFGTGTGGFRAQVVSFASGTDALLSVSAGLLLGGDGLPDIVTVADNQLMLYPNAAVRGGVQFGSGQVVSVANIHFRDVKVADVDGDGLADLVAAGFYATGEQQGKGVVVVLHNSTSGFHGDTDSQILLVGGLTGRVAVGDLNGDSTPDIAVTQSPNLVTVFRSTGVGTYPATGSEVSLLSSKSIDSVAIGQLGGDAGGDLAVICRGPAPSGSQNYYFGYIYVQESDGSFTSQGGVAFGPHDPSPVLSGDVAIADLNGDGNNDVVLTSPPTSAIYVFALQLKADSSIDIDGSYLYHAPSKLVPRYLGIAQLNGDTKPDVVAGGSQAQGSLSVLLNGESGGGGSTTLSKPVLKVFPATRTAPWTFRATFAKPLEDGAVLYLQYSTTPNVAGSWQLVPDSELFTPNANRTIFTLQTNDLPLGRVYFRAFASNGTVGAGSNLGGPYTIAARIDAFVSSALITERNAKFSKAKGLKVYYNGQNIARTESVLNVPQGSAAFFRFTATNTGDSPDTLGVQGPGATTDGFLIRYYSDTYFTHDYTDAVVAGTYTEEVGKEGSVSLVAVVRAPAGATVGSTKSIDVSFTSMKDEGVHDLARATVKVVAAAPYTVFVTTATDNGNDTAPTPGSLRAAILYTQQNFTHKVRILFEVPPGTTGRSVLPLATDLKPLTVTALTEIDGTSNNFYVGLVTGNMKIYGPTVELRGAGASTGLTLQTSGALVRSLRFANFTTGLVISGAALPESPAIVRANVVKTCVFVGNSDAGVLVTGGARSNLIGDKTYGAENIFVSYRADENSSVIGNYGIKVNGGSVRTYIYRNSIGFSHDANDVDDPDPTLSWGFNEAGISISGGAQETYVGDSIATRNYVAGNRGPNSRGVGLELLGVGTNENQICGNLFGRTKAGQLRGNHGANLLVDEGASFNHLGDQGRDRGNELVGSADVGIRIQSSVTGKPVVGNSVYQNLVGGTRIGDGNANGGIFVIGTDCTGTTIGGSDGLKGNTILGNAQDNASGAGIAISGGSNTRVIFNLVGAGAANQRGILLQNANGNFLYSNTVSNNLAQGIELLNSSDNVLTGNYIGQQTTAQQVVPPNGGVGLLLHGSSNRNQIGTGEPKFGNTISRNTGKGLVVADSSTGNSIRANTILGNAGTSPIDLGDDGVTANDVGDGDSGPNDLQNAPVLNSATFANGRTTISITFKSTPKTGSVAPAYWLDFYANGEWKGFLKAYTDAQGEGVLSAAADGNGTFSVPLTANLRGQEIRVTATRIIGAGATAKDGSTSEFSNGVTP